MERTGNPDSCSPEVPARFHSGGILILKIEGPKASGLGKGKPGGTPVSIVEGTGSLELDILRAELLMVGVAPGSGEIRHEQPGSLEEVKTRKGRAGG